MTIEQEIDVVDAAETYQDEEKVEKQITFDALQRVGVTGQVVDVIQQEDQGGNPDLEGDEGSSSTQTVLRAYLLALDPQDALILKYLRDSGAAFDLVVRAPTSQIEFELNPVMDEFITEFYGLKLIR